MAVRTAEGKARRRLRVSLGRAFNRMFRLPMLPFTMRLLRGRMRRATSVDAALDLAYGFRFAGVNFIPWQERSEIRSLLELVALTRPRVVLEIGTSNGGSLFLLAQVAAADAVIVSVDLPHGRFGGGYPRWRGLLYHGFATKLQQIRLLRADSHRQETLDAVRTALEGRPVDVIFIDGDHTYRGVKQDFEMYRPLVRSGGIIAFHDIVPSRAEVRSRGTTTSFKAVRCHNSGRNSEHSTTKCGYL